MAALSSSNIFASSAAFASSASLTASAALAAALAFAAAIAFADNSSAFALIATSLSSLVNPDEPNADVSVALNAPYSVNECAEYVSGGGINNFISSTMVLGNLGAISVVEMEESLLILLYVKYKSFSPSIIESSPESDK